MLPANVVVEPQHVAGTVHMLTGAGGNIAASIGEDGTLIVDDQYAPLSGRIQAALDALGGERPKLVLNTHYHGDHTGGNAALGAAGSIIAHDNVRIRLLAGNDVQREMLPAVTFADRLNVHFNDEEIVLIHLPRGHTDGDSVVWFKSANVIHMGDHLFSGSYPYVDVPSGGSVAGMLANLRHTQAMIPRTCKVIPGHGPLGDYDTITAAIDLIRRSTALIVSAEQAGASDSDIVRQLNQEFPRAGAGFINAERWLAIVRSSR